MYFDVALKNSIRVIDTSSNFRVRPFLVAINLGDMTTSQLYPSLLLLYIFQLLRSTTGTTFAQLEVINCGPKFVRTVSLN